MPNHSTEHRNVAIRAFLIFFSSHWMRLSPLGIAATLWPIIPAPDDDDDGTIGGMRIGRGNRSTRSKPTEVHSVKSTVRAGK
jgi:hypothetical protein